MNLDKLIESLNDEELSYLRGKLNSLMSKKTTVTSFIESHKHEMSTWLIKCLKSATIKTGSRISGGRYIPLEFIDDITEPDFLRSQYCGTKTVYEFYKLLKRNNLNDIIHNGQFNKCEYLKKYTQYNY